MTVMSEVGRKCFVGSVTNRINFRNWKRWSFQEDFRSSVIIESLKGVDLQSWWGLGTHG